MATQPGLKHPSFNTTNWTVIRQASRDSSESKRALSELLECYWYPCYAFVRKYGVAVQDAEDCVQDFFRWVIESNVLARADAERGRFRTFLLTALQQFRIREQRFHSAQKRSPGSPVLSIDMADGETRYSRELYDRASPENAYDHAWGIATIQSALQRLHSDFESQGKSQHFNVLRGFLTGDAPLSGKEAAKILGVSEVAFRSLVYRMKQKLARIVRNALMDTLDCETDIADELNELKRCLQLRGSHDE